MLIVNFHTLQTIYSLYFTQQIILHRPHTFDLQNIMRIYGTFCQFVTGLQYGSIHNFNAGTIWNQVCLGFPGFLIRYNNLTFLFRVFNRCNAAKLCNNCKTFRFSCFKQLLYTRKPLCNIVSRNAAGVERTHRKLRTRFTDRLCGDNANSLAYLHRLSCRHIRTITLRTHSIQRPAR